MPPWSSLDTAVLALVGLLALLTLPLTQDLASWLIGAGLFGGSFLVSAGASVLHDRWRGGGDRPPEAGVR